jgi:hypothetical protein
VRNTASIAVIVPAYNEGLSIRLALEGIPDWVDQIVVADNASTDDTAEIARASGATVVFEPEPGYGAACLRAITALESPDIVVFMDADCSDNPAEMGLLVDPILADRADLVIGSRVTGHCEARALTPQQRIGNRLACGLIRLLYSVRYTDLGPFRAVRYSTLIELEMRDRNYGWTAEMQIKAARHRARIMEVPVSYRKRIGRSKISGTLAGALRAGTKILYTIVREAFRPQNRCSTGAERLILFTRYPEPGKTKTRLIPVLGEGGAADLQRLMTVRTVETARQASDRGRLEVQVHFDGGPKDGMHTWLAPDLVYRPQSEGDLGDRMQQAFESAFSEDCRRAVIIGTDCPDLCAHDIRQAFASLRSVDVVLGPASDGGYYLIGLRGPAPELFRAIPWGTENVLEETLRRARDARLTTRLLRRLDDVDRPEDLALWQRCQSARPPAISVVIPTLNEEHQVAAAIASARLHDDVEVIVVDGGSSDRTRDISKSLGARVISAQRGRARQMNAGAAAAQGATVLFLHADTQLPPGYTHKVHETLAKPGVIAGAFRLEIQAHGISYRLIERMANRRSVCRQLPYGDQALFMRKDIWKAIGGFPDLPIMEDYELVRRLRDRGAISVVDWPVTTSARRWQRFGPWKVTALHQLVILGYRLGVPANRLLRLRSP